MSELPARPYTLGGDADGDALGLRDRVRLYLEVILAVDLLAWVSDLVTPLLDPDHVAAERPASFVAMRATVTGILILGALLTRFAPLGPRVSASFDVGITLALAMVDTRLALVFGAESSPAMGASFALIGVVLLLVVRAALVPSPVWRTVAVGTGALLVAGRVAHPLLDALSPVAREGLGFMGVAFVLVTAVTSRVIYGLRQEVRDLRRLGQYTLEEKIGEGGMGSVHRARHAHLRRPAAIKLVRPASDSEARARARERFEREAHVTASLLSPHTVQLYDFGVSPEGDFYYVMELLDGVDLDTLVARYGPLEPARVVFVLQQVCDSLAEAHELGLVHRDVKPANVFLCRYGRRYDLAKVLDFGLVAVEPERGPGDAKLTAEGMAAGTPAYLAPEQVADPDGVDGRADLYALGCVAYWLLTGRPPFEGRSPMQTVLAHVNEAPTPPSQRSDQPIPPGLEALVMQCLEKRPEARPESADALAGALAGLELEPWTQARASRWWATHRPRGPEAA